MDEEEERKIKRLVAMCELDELDVPEDPEEDIRYYEKVREVYRQCCGGDVDFDTVERIVTIDDTFDLLAQGLITPEELKKLNTE
ncbi:MAG: hypothetical protein R6U61_04545 [Thermoplasmata archaeon]